MADLKKTVEIVFGGKNELSKTIGQIEGEFTNIEAIVGNITRPLAAIGEGVLKADAALAALAVGGMALALKSSSDFNSSFGLISTSVTATGSDLDKFRADVLDYANGSVKSIADINGALYTAVQAGVDYTNSIEFIGKAEQLAVANKANLNTTVDLLTATMNAYGFTIQDVGRLNDVYFTSTLIGKQTIDELGASMGQVVTIAATSGVSFEEMSAAISTMTAKGMETSAAITALRGVITTFTNPSEEARKAAAALGIDLSYAGLSSKGLAGAMEDVMAKTGGSTAKMIELFSEMKAMAGVTAITGDGMKFFGEALDKIKGSAGSAEEAYQKMVNTFSNQAQLIKNQATTLLVEIGTTLEPMALKIGGGISALLAGIKTSVEGGAFDSLFAYLKEVSDSLGNWLAGIGQALPDALNMIDFNGLILALQNLRAAFSSYLDGLDMTKPEDLASVIQFLVDGISGLVNITAQMVTEFKPFIEQIGEFLVQMAQADDETQKTTGTLLALAMVIEKCGLFFAAALKAAQEYGVGIGQVFDIVTGGAQVMWNGMQLIGDAIKGLILIVEGSIVDMLDKLTFGMFPGLEELKKDITKQGEEVSKAFYIDGEDAARGLDKFIAGFGTIGDTLGKGADTAGKMKERISEIGESASNATPPVDSLYEQLEELGQQVVNPKVSVTADKKSVEDAIEVIEIVPKTKDVKVTATTDEKALKDQQAALQKAVEVQAKIDIAQIEAAVKTTEAVFDNVDLRIKSTQDVYETLIKGMTDPSLHWSQKESLATLLEAEAEHRKKAMEQSEKLTEQQIEINKLKLEALRSGANEITVRADGLKPHLEMILWEILEAIQIRASASQAEFLLGFSG